MGDRFILRRHRKNHAGHLKIRLAQLRIHMKLRVALSEGLISLESFRERFHWYEKIFAESYNDIYFYRRNYPLYFFKLFEIKEKFLTDLADSLHFPALQSENN